MRRLIIYWRFKFGLLEWACRNISEKKVNKYN